MIDLFGALFGLAICGILVLTTFLFVKLALGLLLLPLKLGLMLFQGVFALAALVLGVIVLGPVLAVVVPIAAGILLIPLAILGWFFRVPC